MDNSIPLCMITGALFGILVAVANVAKAISALNATLNNIEEARKKETKSS